MKTSEQINEIAAAMAKAQQMLKPAHKDSTNPAYRSKYADMASVWAAWQEAGPQCGLAVWQDVTTVEGGIAVATLITHASGQWMEFGPLIVPIGKHDAHGVGSATTYGKRFGLAASVGLVADEDDDGNGAVASKPDPTVGKIAGYYRGTPPKSTAPVEDIGRPDRPAGTDPAKTEKDARALFATPAEDAERAVYIKELKRLKTKLKLTDEKTTEYGNTYLGAGVSVATADLPDLALLVDFLRKTAGEPKYGAEPPKEQVAI